MDVEWAPQIRAIHGRGVTCRIHPSIHRPHCIHLQSIFSYRHIAHNTVSYDLSGHVIGYTNVTVCDQSD